MAWRPPRSSGNPNRRQPSFADEPKVVVKWKDPQVGYGLAKREKPARYRSPGTFCASYKQKLVIGAAMVATVPLIVIPHEKPQYPFPTLRRAYRREAASVPKGMFMIYAGTVRVKERARVARETVDLEVPKHTFIIPNVGRCIIHDMRLAAHA